MALALSAADSSPTPPGSGSGPSTRSKSSSTSRMGVAPVLQFWKAFDLDSKRVMLDAQGSGMKTEKEASVRSRKKLAETTKNFRRLPDADKIAAVGGLLRAYQEEVDHLTRRAKFSENAFFMLYKELYAAPDPVSSLEIIADMKVPELEEDNKRLRRELRDYEAEFASLKNQDITIRRLEEQLSAAAHDLDDKVHEEVEKRTQQLEAHLEAKNSELAQQKVNYERQLEASRAELREAFSRLDAMQSDLFEQKQRSGLAKSALDVEMEAISQDALLTQTLQLQNAQLKKQLEDALSASTDALESPRTVSGGNSNGVNSRDRQEQEAVVSALRQDISQLKEDLVRASAAAASDKVRLESELRTCKSIQTELERELSSRPTAEQYANVVRQLRVLQQLEYNIVDEDEGEADGSSDGTSAKDKSDSSVPSEIEKVLVSRVRRLENSLHQREREIQERSNELQLATMELEATKAKIDEQAALVRNLEETVALLDKARKAGGMFSSGGMDDVGSEILLDAVEDQLSISSSNDLGAAAAVAAGSMSAAAMSGSDSKMLEIVRGQRDRFRERMKELQGEKNRVEELAQSYKSSVARLENDNMQLYHKIRYLQSYRGNTGTGGSSNSASSVNHRVFPGSHAMASALEDGHAGGSGADVEAKYRGIYEEKMNPFVQFNKMESQQRYTNLNVVDKILLNSARLLLGHRVTRNIAFSYILLLHLLVVATLYTFMHGCGISNE